MSVHEDEFPQSDIRYDRFKPMPHKCGACVIDRERDGEIFCRIEVKDLEIGDQSTALARAQDIAIVFNQIDKERWAKIARPPIVPAAEDEDLVKASDFPRVEIDLSSAEFDALERLVGRGTYGSTPDDVALYLISRGIDDLVRAGVL